MAQPTLAVARPSPAEEGMGDSPQLDQIRELHRQAGRRPGRPTVARHLGIPESQARRLLDDYDAASQPASRIPGQPGSAGASQPASQGPPAARHLAPAATAPSDGSPHRLPQDPAGATTADVAGDLPATGQSLVMQVTPNGSTLSAESGPRAGQAGWLAGPAEPASTSQVPTAGTGDGQPASQSAAENSGAGPSTDSSRGWWATVQAAGWRALAEAPLWLPVAATLAMAWHGQFEFAKQQLQLPIGFAALAAAFLEALMLGTNRWAHRRRRAGERALALRAFAIVCAGLAATMNYWHFAPTWSPTQPAVTYGLASVLGFAYWEITSSASIRADLVEQGLRPPARPVQTAGWGPRLSVPRGVARAVLHPLRTWRAWDVSLCDPRLTPDEAWRKANAD